MGLLKAILGGTRTVLADQWVDYIKCDALPVNVIAAKGVKAIGPKSSNTKSSDNIITDGSRVDVADGQFMLIVENGLIVDYCAEPGQYTYQTGTQPSLMSGGFKNLGATFKEIGKRFTAGGQELTTQRVYYINTKELLGNKWGVGAVPFRDSEFNFTMKISAYGEYSYKITNPLMFYKNVCGNIDGYYVRANIDSQLKAELQTAMQPTLGRIALKRIPYDQLPLFTRDICSELNAELTEDWVNLRGISVVAFAVAAVAPDEESAKKIAEFQESRVYADSRMMGARLGTAQATAMETAAGNSAGAVTGFLGMGFAGQAGGMNANELYQMGDEKGGTPPQGGATAEPATESSAGDGLTPPTADESWKCPECETYNKSKFCTDCGAKRPAGSPVYRCDKCGWQPEDPRKAPKFCPECGDRFDDNDIEA